jgi:hypothetical protein
MESLGQSVTFRGVLLRFLATRNGVSSREGAHTARRRQERTTSFRLLKSTLFPYPWTLESRYRIYVLHIRWAKSVLKVSHLLPYPLTIVFDRVAEERSERGHRTRYTTGSPRDEFPFDEDDYSSVESSNATERLTPTLPAFVPVRRYTSRHSEADVSSAYGDTHLILGLSNFPTSSLVTPATMLWSAGAPNACPYCGNYLVNGRCLNPRHS